MNTCKQFSCYLIFFLISNLVVSQHYAFIPETKYGLKQAAIRKNKKIRSIEGLSFKDTISYDDINNAKKLYKTVYNTSGKRIEKYSRKRKGLGLYLSTRFEYNNKGQLIAMFDLAETGEVIHKHLAKYKDSILILSESFMNSSGPWFDYSKKVYDSIGQPVYKIERENGKTIDSVFYHKNKLGKVITEEHFDEGELAYKIQYELLNEYDYIERIYEPDLSLRLKRYWKFSPKGIEIERVQYNSEESIKVIYKKEFNCEGKISSNLSLGPEFKILGGSKYDYKDGKRFKQNFVDKTGAIYAVWYYIYNHKEYSEVIIRTMIEDGKETIEGLFCEKTTYFD